MKTSSLAILLITLSFAAKGEPACPTTGDSSIAITAVEPGLELRLSDGRRLRLVGLDPAAPTPTDADLAETARARLARDLDGKTLTASLTSARPDRWGRIPAMVFADGIAAGGGLSGLAIAEGLARYTPEPAAHACRSALLAHEGDARAAKLGLWRDPYFGVVAVDQRDAFIERSATMVVAEGTLWRVDSGPFRTKLRFVAPGQNRRDLLEAVIAPKVSKRLAKDGVHFEQLVGTALRLRGLLDLSYGPQIEIANGDAIEIVSASSATAPVAAGPVGAR